jgi:hypothetical protein
MAVVWCGAAAPLALRASVANGRPWRRRRLRLRITSGNFCEQFDFFLFGFSASYISAAFFPSQSQFASLMMTFSVFGAGYLMRPLGAMVLACDYPLPLAGRCQAKSRYQGCVSGRPQHRYSRSQQLNASVSSIRWLRRISASPSWRCRAIMSGTRTSVLRRDVSGHRARSDLSILNRANIPFLRCPH